MNDTLKISFKLTDETGFSYIGKNGEETLSCTVSEGRITCRVWYDFNDQPLVMSSKAGINDIIEIVLMPHRTELWVNSSLKDEEWPAGNRLFDVSDTAVSKLEMVVEEYVPKKAFLPAVIGEFENAEGWQPEENVFVGDCMPYVCGNRYHVLYLKDRHHHGSKWGFGAHQWEHISTENFKTWQIHPTAIAIDDPVEGSICTGSWIKKDDTYYLFYTVRMSDRSPAPIKRCVSGDGYHFEKDQSFSLILSEKYHAPSARDPKVILNKDGFFHMFLTTSIQGKGCLAHLISKDLTVWKECEEPMMTHRDHDQPECPDYIKYHGYYYLLYSIKGKAQYMYSKEPFGPWIIPENPVIPCSSVPKGAVYHDRIVFTGFVGKGGYAGTMTFKSAVNNENGVLIFE